MTAINHQRPIFGYAEPASEVEEEEEEEQVGNGNSTISLKFSLLTLLVKSN